MSQSACIDKAQNALNGAGAKNINVDGSAVFAKVGSGRVTINCIAERQLVQLVVLTNYLANCNQLKPIGAN